MKIITTLIILSFSVQLSAQQIHQQRGYDLQIGTLLSMMDDLKLRIERSVNEMSQKETDFLLDAEANRVGALILHLAATEKYYQLYTFENRGFNSSESEWSTALNLGDRAREEFQNKPISYYMNKWNEVRKETKKLLKTKDEKWLQSNVGESRMNNHWAWYHVMEHQANHMGQIRLIMGRM